MSATPQFIATPKNGTTQIDTANTNLDGTGTLGTVYTAGSNGGRVDQLRIQSVATTTAGMVRLFLYDGSSNTRLIREINVPAVTPSGTVPAWGVNVEFEDGLVLQSGYVLKAATHTGDDFNVIVTRGGDF